MNRLNEHSSSMKKQSIIAIIITIGLLLIAIFMKGLYSSDTSQNAPIGETVTKNSEYVSIVKTNPAQLENGIIAPSQTIEITFSEPLENEGEFKHILNPATDYKVQLSADKKTVKIVPNKPYQFNTPYNLVIQTETKFDGGKKLERHYEYHFSTISYSGV